MITVTVIPPKSSENNPLGKEVVQRASEQLIKIRHNDLKSKLEKLKCEHHPDEPTNISLTMEENGVVPFVDACCPLFLETIKVTIREIHNI